MRKIKKILSLCVAVALFFGVFSATEQKVCASEQQVQIDGSYLMDDLESEGMAENLTRGIYLKSGTSRITNNGGGKIGAGGATVGEKKVESISVYVVVERLVNGYWYTYTSWSATKTNAYSVSTSKELTVPKGYYYRVCCTHYANSDVSDSFTNGIYIS